MTELFYSAIYIAIAALVGAGATFLLTKGPARNKKALFREKELAEARLSSIGDAVIATDVDAKIEYLNPWAEKLTGWTLDQARGQPLDLVFQVIDEHTRAPIPHVREKKSSLGISEVEKKSVRLVHKEGLEYSIHESCSTVNDCRGRAVGMIIIFYDITNMNAMAQHLTWQANHDALTGLVNRREFERRMGTLLETAKTQHKQHALLFMDLDNFKVVNDTCGHGAGDEFLRQLTSVMQIKMRGSDTMARFGGDEFAALLESCPLDQALRIANGMREAIRDFRFVWKDKTFCVGASMGLVPITESSEGIAELLSAGDESCYEAKSKGRDRVLVYRPKDKDFTHKHVDLQMISQINHAFELGNFRLFQQKIIPLSGHFGVTHYEVLVRMLDLSGNLVPPMAFIPAAERYNLLTMIDRWVITALVAYLDEQCKLGAIPRTGQQDNFYAVNLSGASINDNSFPDFLSKLLSQHKLPPGLLCLEVTETTAISNLSKAADLMHQLKAIGCRFALDDFGIGMSSFAYLKYLPVDFLKIDGVFVKDMASNKMDYAIVEAINRISHSIGMQTVAECVEDGDTLFELKALGIDYAQGFYISKPELIGAPREMAVA